MRVLMLVSWYTPMGNEALEAGVFHYEQSMDLKKHCDVALYYPFDNMIDQLETKAEEWGLLTYRSKFSIGKRLFNHNNMKRTMKRIIEEFNPDIIHAHCGAAAGSYAVKLAKRYKLPVVITEHEPVEISHVDKKGIRYWITKRAYKFSKANVCVSQDSMNKLSKIFKDCNFQVIYNGIILPTYNQNSKKYYKEGYINIAIVAILYDLEIKGLKYLLKAIEMLKKQGKKVALHHIGGGEYLEHFKNMAKELDIEDVCTFYGKCDRTKLYEIVNEMDFFCSSSLMECSGVSVQEAMLLGKPVLGTNSGGVDSLVPEKAGHIVQKASAQALADGIDYMIANLDTYDKEWIKNYANDSFEIGNISRKYMELYSKVLKEEKNK